MKDLGPQTSVELTDKDIDNQYGGNGHIFCKPNHYCWHP